MEEGAPEGAPADPVNLGVDALYLAKNLRRPSIVSQHEEVTSLLEGVLSGEIPVAKTVAPPPPQQPVEGVAAEEPAAAEEEVVEMDEANKAELDEQREIDELKEMLGKA